MKTMSHRLLKVKKEMSLDFFAFFEGNINELSSPSFSKHGDNLHIQLFTEASTRNY